MKTKQKNIGRPRAKIESYITKISHFLVLGYSIKQSCQLGGVPYTTVVDYYRTNESIRTKITVFMTSVGLKARANLVARINAGDYKASWAWLERYEPEEFSLRNIRKKIEPQENEISVIFNGNKAFN